MLVQYLTSKHCKLIYLYKLQNYITPYQMVLILLFEDLSTLLLAYVLSILLILKLKKWSLATYKVQSAVEC